MAEGSSVTIPPTVAEVAAETASMGRTWDQVYFGFTGRVLVNAAYEETPVLDTDGEDVRALYYPPELNAWGRLNLRLAKIGQKAGTKIMMERILDANKDSREKSPSIIIYDRTGRVD